MTISIPEGEALAERTFNPRMGIEGGKYSYTTAVGLFQSMIGLMLTIITNKVSNKITGYGLW